MLTRWMDEGIKGIDNVMNLWVCKWLMSNCIRTFLSYPCLFLHAIFRFLRSIKNQTSSDNIFESNLLSASWINFICFLASCDKYIWYNDDLFAAFCQLTRNNTSTHNRWDWLQEMVNWFNLVLCESSGIPEEKNVLSFCFVSDYFMLSQIVKTP